MADSPPSDSAKQYRALVIKRISDRWCSLFLHNSDSIAVEKINAHISIARDGALHVEGMKPARADDLLYKITLQALRETKIPPVPKDVAGLKPITFDLTFDSK